MEEFDYEFAKLEAEEKMDNALNLYKSNLAKISVGRANPQILDGIKINYFDTLTPINQLSNISVPEPMQLLIKPYDTGIVKEIVGKINSAGLGIHAMDEGDKIRMAFPELTGERRREMVKSLGQYTEQARVLIRSARQDLNKSIKSAELPEDDEKRTLEDVQKLTDSYIAKIVEITTDKESQLTTI